MFLGKVIGKLICTVKDERLISAKLLMVQPVDQNKAPIGKPIVAVDTVQSEQNDFVYLVKSREASIPWHIKNAPIDAAIVGIVDRMEVFSQ